MNRPILLIALCSMLLGACTAEQAPTHLRSVAVVVPQPVGSMTTKQFTGLVEDASEINLGFKTPGQIEQISVKEGDRVQKGQLIARLDPKDYQLAVDALEVQYRQLSAEIERMRQLVEAKSLSQNDYEKAVAGWEQLGIQLQSKRNQLDYTRLTAPVSGYVQSVNFEPAEMVDAGMAVVTLLDTRHKEVAVDVPIEVYQQRKKITGISCHWASTDATMQLLSFTPKADGNQLYRMKLTFADAQAAVGLTAGMNVETSLTIATGDSTATGSHTLPLHAIFNDAGQDYVWTLTPDTLVQKTAVTVAGIDDRGLAIVVGLDGGERVVRAGVNHLQDGEKVNILPQQADTNVGDIL